MDNKERTALINAAIPKEHQSYFYSLFRENGLKVRQGPSSGPFARNKPNRAVQPSLLARSISVFKGMLEWDDYRDASPEQFIAAARVLNYDKRNEGLYLAMTPAAQKFFVRLPKSMLPSRDSGFIYLNTLERLGSAPDLSLTHMRSGDPVSHPPRVMTFTEVLEKALAEVERNFEDANVAEQRHLSIPNQEVVSLMQYRTPLAFNSLDFNMYDALFMWKIIYNDQTVIDFYKTFYDYPYPLTGSQMFTILDDWENFKLYPRDWIMEVGIN